MDHYLRELERQALVGDTDAQDKLQVAYDRLNQPYPESLVQILATRKKWELDPQHGQPETWRQISGDVNAYDYGCVLGRIVNDYIELWRIENVAEHIGEDETREVGAPFWVSETSYAPDDLLDLTIDGNDENARMAEQITSALSSYGLSAEEWNEMDLLSRAEILSSTYGYGDSSTAEGAAVLPVPAEQIIWWSDPQTTEEWVGATDDFRHSIMWNCFTCPQCGARSSIESIDTYGPGPPEIELQRWPWEDAERGGRCGCRMPLRYFLTRIRSNQPIIDCSFCRQELEASS
jgi:hypothetical protein